MTDKQGERSVIITTLAVFALLVAAAFKHGCSMADGIVQVIIDEHGNVQTSVSGVSGPACFKETEGLSDFFGTPAKATPTRDYFDHAAVKQQDKVKQ